MAVAMLPGATALGGATPRSFDPDKPPGKGKDDDAMSFKVHMQFGEGESLGAVSPTLPSSLPSLALSSPRP